MEVSPAAVSATAAIAIPRNLPFLHPPPWLTWLSVLLQKACSCHGCLIKHSLWNLLLALEPKTYRRGEIDWQSLTICASPSFKGDGENKHMACLTFKVEGSFKIHMERIISSWRWQRPGFPLALPSLQRNIPGSCFTLCEATHSLDGELSVLESLIRC